MEMKPLMVKAGAIALLKLPLPNSKMNGANARQTRPTTKRKDNVEWTGEALKISPLLRP
jgi:hypothetical protein